MLLSKKKRFLFIHVPKTGGSSIQHALTPFAIPRWLKPINLALRRRGLTFLDPQPYGPHARAGEVQRRLGPNEYGGYFSFGFVRNPWDWLVSLYTYIQISPTHRHHELVCGLPDFETFLEWRCTEELLFQSDFLCSANGDSLVDFIGRFETLDSDFGRICRHLGISAVLPRLNVSRVKPYQEYYRPDTISMVRAAYEKDIRRFDYEFDQPPGRSVRDREALAA